MTPEKAHFQENLGLNQNTPEQLEKLKNDLKVKVDTLKADGSFSGEDLADLVDLLDDKTILSPTEAELKSHLESLQNLETQIDFLMALVDIGGESGSGVENGITEEKIENGENQVGSEKELENLSNPISNDINNNENSGNSINEEFDKETEFKDIISIDIDNINETNGKKILDFTNNFFDKISNNNYTGEKPNTSIGTITNKLGLLWFQKNIINKIKGIQEIIDFDIKKGLYLKNATIDSTINTLSFTENPETGEILNFTFNKRNILEEINNEEKNKFNEKIDSIIKNPNNLNQEYFNHFINIKDNLSSEQINIIKNLTENGKINIDITKANPKIIGILLENNINFNFGINKPSLENLNINNELINSLKGNNLKKFIKNFINEFLSIEVDGVYINNLDAINDVNRNILLNILKNFSSEELKNIFSEELNNIKNGKEVDNYNSIEYFLVNEHNYKSLGKDIGISKEALGDDYKEINFDDIKKIDFNNINIHEISNIISFTEKLNKNSTEYRYIIDNLFKINFLIDDLEGDKKIFTLFKEVFVNIIKDTDDAIKLVKLMKDKGEINFGNFSDEIKNDQKFIKEIINNFENLNDIDRLININFDKNTTEYILEEIKNKFKIDKNNNNFLNNNTIKKFLGENLHNKLIIFILQNPDKFQKLYTQAQAEIFIAEIKENIKQDKTINDNNNKIEKIINNNESINNNNDNKIDFSNDKFKKFEEFTSILKEITFNESLNTKKITEKLLEGLSKYDNNTDRQNYKEKIVEFIRLLQEEILNHLNKQEEDINNDIKSASNILEKHFKKEYIAKKDEILKKFTNINKNGKTKEQIIEEKKEILRSYKIEDDNELNILVNLDIHNERNNNNKDSIKKTKEIIHNTEAYVEAIEHGATDENWKEKATNLGFELKNEKGEIINKKELEEKNLTNKNNSFQEENGFIFNENFAINTNNSEIITKSGGKISLSTDEIKMLKSNPKLGENIINLYESLERVGLTKLWNYKEDIFKSLENVFRIQFDRKDGNYLDERETKILLNTVLTSLGEKPIRTDKKIDNFLSEVENINGRQVTGAEKEVNKLGESRLEASFIEKFVGRGDMIGFKQSAFENSLKKIN